jgi:hypothetical protein
MTWELWIGYGVAVGRLSAWARRPRVARTKVVGTLLARTGVR